MGLGEGEGEGLEAERMKPPMGTKPAPWHRITADMAGVESSPSVPHHTALQP